MSKSMRSFYQFKLSYIFIVIIYFVSVHSTTAQTDIKLNKQTTSEAEQLKSLVKQIKKVDQATKHARNAVKSLPDSSLLPNLLFQLAELELRRDKLHFEYKMLKYDKQLKLIEQNKLSNEPEEPILSYENTLKINRQIIENYPDADFLNKILYRNAICLYETGHKDSSKKIFLKLIPQCADSSLLAELYFRLGECYFEEGAYQKALVTYQKILEKWNSPFFAMSLYKIAWCHYRMNNISDAIGTFYYLLNDINLLEKIDSEILGKTQIELQQESIDYIAIGFSDFGGLKSLLEFMREMGNSQYDPDFLYKFGEVNFKRNFYKKTIQAFDVLLKRYPTYEKLPEVFLCLYDCFENIGNRKIANSMIQRLRKTCGPGSRWALENNTDKDKQFYENIALNIQHKMATPILKSADSLFARKQFRDAALKYVQILQQFPDDSRNDHVTYCLAESFFGIHKYELAAKNYKKVVLNYPDSDFFEDAAYNHLVCYDKILTYSDINIKDTTRSPENCPAIKNLIRACHDFLNWVPNSEKTPEIMLKLAELFYHQKMFYLGEKYAKSTLIFISKHNKCQHYKLVALDLLAQTNFQQDRYQKAKKWYTVLKQQKPDSTALREKCDKMIASAQFKIGEQLKEGGNIEQAAHHFQKSALKTKDIHVASAALFESAVQFEKIGKLKKAAKNFEMLYQKYPNSQHVSKAVYRAGALREKLQQWHLAGNNYLNLYKLLNHIDEKSSALLNAGLAFEKAKDWHAVADIFSQFVDQCPPNHDQIIEAMFKIGLAYENLTNQTKAEFWYRRTLSKYDRLITAGGFADDFIAARATFRIAELKNIKFQNIKLTPPLQVKLRQKQKMFNDLLEAYVRVAKFDIAEWTTASFYRIGLAYEKFCQDILNSPTPKNLNRIQENDYWASIQHQWIIPLQKEALKYYQSNENLALQSSLHNNWVSKSKERIAFIRSQLANQNAIPIKEQYKQAKGTTEKRNNSRRRTL